MKHLLLLSLLFSINSFAGDDFSCEGIRPISARYGLCDEFINPQANFCTIECDLSQNHLATCRERLMLENELMKALENAHWHEKQFRMENLRAAKDICVPGVRR